jgi:BirA family biotin operon repressor/biotin-[acetyl-CoA-carboxylase] ligase
MNVEFLDEGAITQALAGSYWRVSVLDETTSTQEVLRTSSPQHGDVLAAEFQSTGRGRLDRKFEAVKAAALLFSLYIEPQAAKSRWSFLPLLVGHTLAEVLNHATSTDKYLTKWPNDILINEKKVSGTLVELAGSGVIIGVGINTHLDEASLPVPTATSILLESNLNISRDKLLTDFLSAFASHLMKWEAGASYVQQYCATSSTLGRRVGAQLPSGEILEGVAVGIEPSGSLILDSGSEVNVGDVVHLR